MGSIPAEAVCLFSRAAGRRRDFVVVERGVGVDNGGLGVVQ